MSFAQPAATVGKDADAEILAAIDKIEFDFGRDRFTTAQAELLFTYEIGIDLDRLYVIALSKNCGTVIFCIPDDLTGRIMERARELDCTVGRYLADLAELRWAAEPATALARVEPDPLNEVVAALSDTATHTAEMDPETSGSLWNAVHAAESGHLEIKSNNWLKMHGFPMRRKGKGRKHHE